MRDKPLGERTRWGWGGVYSTKEKAEAACLFEDDFISECEIDEGPTGKIGKNEYPLFKEEQNG